MTAASVSGSYVPAQKVCDCDTCPSCGGLRKRQPYSWPVTPTYPYVTWTSGTAPATTYLINGDTSWRA